MDAWRLKMEDDYEGDYDYDRGYEDDYDYY
jgi:hypothetical protein